MLLHLYSVSTPLFFLYIVSPQGFFFPVGDLDLVNVCCAYPSLYISLLDTPEVVPESEREPSCLLHRADP
jgi:hypothetical protein